MTGVFSWVSEFLGLQLGTVGGQPITAGWVLAIYIILRIAWYFLSRFIATRALFNRNVGYEGFKSEQEQRAYGRFFGGSGGSSGDK